MTTSERSCSRRFDAIALTVQETKRLPMGIGTTRKGDYLRYIDHAGNTVTFGIVEGQLCIAVTPGTRACDSEVFLTRDGVDELHEFIEYGKNESIRAEHE